MRASKKVTAQHSKNAAQNKHKIFASASNIQVNETGQVASTQKGFRQSK